MARNLPRPVRRSRPVSLVVLLLLIANMVLLTVAVVSPGTFPELKSGVLLGFLAFAISHYMGARENLRGTMRNRLQDARGLARALATEIDVFANLSLRDGHSLPGVVRSGTIGETNRAAMSEFIELPARAVFDANIGALPLLEVLEVQSEAATGKERLVEDVVGFYEGVIDMRYHLLRATLEDRPLTTEEVLQIGEVLKSRAKFAFSLAKRLRTCVEASESSWIELRDT